MPYLGNTAGNRFVASKAASVYSGNGSTTAFTLEHAVGSDEDILVSVDGVIQEPSVAYAVSSGTTLTFTAAPSSNSGNNIFVYYLFRTVATVDHPATSALTATSGTFTGAFTSLGIDDNASSNVMTVSTDAVDIDGNVDITGTSNGIATLIKPQGALADNNDNAGIYVLHQGTAGTGLRVRTDNALTGSNFAHILVNNASASINAFQVSQYGSGLIAKFDKSGTTVMQIDNSGHVTKPLQSAFLARPSSRQADLAINTTHTIAFGTEVFDQNGDFSSNTFTAPVTGKYQLNLQLLIQQMDSATDYYYINLKTSNRNYDQYWDNNDKAGDNGNGAGVSAIVLADMDANDTAVVEITPANSGTAQMDVETASAFSGYLVC